MNETQQHQRPLAGMALWHLLVGFSLTLILWRAFQWYRPKDLDGLVHDGLYAVQQDQIPQAQISLDVLLSIAPSSPQANLLQGAILARQKKFSEAIVVLDRAKAAPTTSARAAMLLGQSHFQQRHLCLAALELSRAIEADSNNNEAKKILVEALDGLGAAKQALEFADQLAAVSTDNLELNYLCAKTHLNNRSFLRAAELLTHCSGIVGKGKQRIPILEDLAVALLECGDLERLKEILKSVPINNTKMLVVNARYQQMLGNFESAEESLQEALELDSNNQYIQQLIESNKASLTGLTSQPNTPRHSTTTQANLDSARARAAEDLANPELRFLVGIAELEQGLRENAAKSFREVISLKHNYLEAHEQLAKLEKGN